MTTDKLLKIVALPVLVLAVAMVGCEGDVGPAGPPGPEGPEGPPGENALNTCSECHSEDTELMSVQMQFEAGAHYETVYWARSGSCSACHNHNGFMTSVINGEEIPDSFDNPVPINCRTCHLIHTEFGDEDYDLTTTTAVALTTGGTHDHGSGNLCANCHQARAVDPAPEIGGDPVTVTSFRYGPHYGTQSNMLSSNAMYEFAGSASYDVTTPHALSCTMCHMVTPVADNHDSSYLAAGHVFSLSYEEDGEAIEACTQCHSSAESFDAFGGQTDVAEMMDELAALLTAEGILREDGYANEGEFDADVAAAFLNYKFVYYDGSYGVHNPHYVQALLTNTIEAMEARIVP